VSGTAPSDFTVTGDYGLLEPGTHNGSVTFGVTVKGVLFETRVPVTVNWEAQRLVPLYNGIALSSFPTASRGLTTRQIPIRDSHGRSGIPWSATSSQPWLQVSPANGVTGNTLTVTALPGAPAANQTHIATVTLTSSNPAIERDETIRVGLWKGSADPVDVAPTLPEGAPRDVVTSPVEPWAFVLSNDGTISVYNVYTGNLATAGINTLVYESGASNVGGMAISSDGTRLFVTDIDGLRTMALDPLTGTMVAEYPTVNGQPPPDTRFGPAVGRLSGHPVLFSAFDSIPFRQQPVDLETGEPLTTFASGSIASTQGDPGRIVSPDGKYLHAWSGGTLIRLDFTRFSALDDGPHIELDRGDRSDYFSLFGAPWDYCVSTDNRVYVLQDSLISVQQFDFMQQLAVINLPGPPDNRGYAIHCGWNGRVYVGRPSATTDDNVLVYDSAGATVSGAPYRHGPAEHLFLAQRFELSGDATRLVWPGIGPLGGTVLAISDVP
jgi:WD40 repeat protein